MNKNPFSIYDFLGYLFPGFITITLVIYIVLMGKNDAIQNYFSITNFIRLYSNAFKGYKLESATIMLVLSYITGHVIGYLSSTIVEYLANKTLGYPSDYLLHHHDYTVSGLFHHYLLTGTEVMVKFWRLLVIFIMSPVSFALFTFGVHSFLIYFIARPLDDYIIDSINFKLRKLCKKCC